MDINLNKVNLKFRQLVDLLFYTDNLDIELSNFKSLLKENYNIHFEYLWSRFTRCAEVAWENGEKFWSHRLTFLLSLNEKKLSKYIQEYIDKRMFSLIRSKYNLDLNYDIEYLQFLELYKVKRERQDDLTEIKRYIVDMPGHIKLDKLINLVNSTIPVIFTDLNEFANILIKKAPSCSRSFELLIALEDHGVTFNKQPIVSSIKEIIIKRKHVEKNRRAFFTLLNNKEIASLLKREYIHSYRANLIDLIESCTYSLLEDFHLRNIKNLIELDPSLADELSIIYANKVYARYAGHKKANADKMIRLLKMVPQISPKKILVYLSSTNKLNDVKYMLRAFPELKKLAAFI